MYKYNLYALIIEKIREFILGTYLAFIRRKQLTRLNVWYSGGSLFAKMRVTTQLIKVFKSLYFRAALEGGL